MNKVLIALVIILGFITSLAINYNYSKDIAEPTPEEAFRLKFCAGEDSLTNSVTLINAQRVIGGKPFSKQTKVTDTLSDACGSGLGKNNIVPRSFLEKTINALSTWQFYANWTFWSLVFVPILYLGGRRYAYNRH